VSECERNKERGTIKVQPKVKKELKEERAEGVMCVSNDFIP